MAEWFKAAVLKTVGSETGPGVRIPLSPPITSLQDATARVSRSRPWQRLSRMDPVKVFLWVAMPVGVLLVAVTPPFQVPDEPNHFYRAYQVSVGQLVSQRTSTSVGGQLPRSFLQVTGTVMGNVPFNPDVKQNLDAWAHAFDIPLRPHDRVEVGFPNTALTGPIAYMPQVLGIELGRLVGASTLMLFYWGRIASLLLCVALTACAIRWLTVRRWTCVLLSLLPMTLFVRSSVSSDGPTLALTMLALAICLLPAALETPSVHLKVPGLLFSIASLMAFGKPPYGAVAFLALAIPPRLLGGTKRYVSTMLALTVVFVIAQGAWALALRGKTAVSAPGADPPAQTTFVVDHPGDAAALLVSDFVRSAPVLTHQALGVLGWLDAPIPSSVAVFLGLMLVLVAFGEPGLPPTFVGFRWLGVVICGVGTLTLLGMNYLWWTPPGASHVEGIQGRHLLPLVPFLFLSINAPTWIGRPLSRVRPVCVIAFLVVSVTTTVLTVVNRYYLDR